MSELRCAVIGGGIFGCLAAIKLAGQGYTVDLFERGKDLLYGASLNNQNRLHLGYHYPRDDNTALQCIRGFPRFRQEFASCINGSFDNNYYIAAEGSLVSFDRFEAFCTRVGLPFDQLNPDFPITVDNVEGGIKTEEVVYDSNLLRDEVIRRLEASNVSIYRHADVQHVTRDGDQYRLTVDAGDDAAYDYVINCTYANYNKFHPDLGLPVKVLQYEYTVIPIIALDCDPFGVTIMDGPFMTVLPFGCSKDFLLYHVDTSVVTREFTEHLDPAWLDPETAPTAAIDKTALFETMMTRAAKFIPATKQARLVGFLEGPRVVFPNRDDTDERPSIIENLDGNGFFSVFSGKIDHSIWVADELAERIGAKEQA